MIPNSSQKTATCQECWRRASREYLGGFELGSDAKIIRYPSHWGDNGEEDAEDIELWKRIQQLLDEIENEEKSQPTRPPDAMQGDVTDPLGGIARGEGVSVKSFVCSAFLRGMRGVWREGREG